MRFDGEGDRLWICLRFDGEEDRLWIATKVVGITTSAGLGSGSVSKVEKKAEELGAEGLGSRKELSEEQNSSF